MLSFQRSLIGRESRFAAQRLRAKLHRAKGAEACADLEAFVLFIGYPRSGHTLVGTLLNAHPEAVIAHELNVLRHVQRGFSREEIAYLLIQKDRWFSHKMGSRWAGYDYAVDGQYQGAWTRLRVIGVKKGDGALVELQHDPKMLERLEAVVGVPVKCIHYIRHPYDNVATFARKKGWPLERALRGYRRRVETALALRVRRPDLAVCDMYHEDFVADPRAELARVCGFLGLVADRDYLDACAALVF